MSMLIKGMLVFGFAMALLFVWVARWAKREVGGEYEQLVELYPVLTRQVEGGRKTDEKARASALKSDCRIM